MGFLDFFGKGARKDLKRGSALYDANVQSFGKKAMGTQQASEGRRLGFFEPYSQAGLGAQNLYSDYLGVNGPEARGGFFDDLQFGPEFEAANKYGIRALDRSAAARGSLYSGNQLESLYDFGMTNFGNFLNPYVDRLERAAGQGANIAGAQSGVVGDVADYVSDTQFGMGQLLGNNAVNTGNALAANRQTGMNNLLGLAQVAAAAYGGGMGGLGGLGGSSSAPQWDTRAYTAGVF